MKRLSDYRHIVGDAAISDIYQRARKLYNKRILHINSTFIGGGVAEILGSLAPLMNSAGLDADWRVLHGNADLFNITKQFHNALQGDSIELTDDMKKVYVQASEDFAAYALIDHDVIIVHDPQPLPLIDFYKKNQPWIWRCHIDLTHPDESLWDYLKGMILKYDLAVVSHEKYVREDLPVRYRIIQPVIDPLTRKNRELTDTETAGLLDEFNIPIDKPILTQISRFDKWKDPIGVIKIYEKVRRKVDCRLILCGNMAMDDPEGVAIHDEIKNLTDDLVESGDVILLTYESSLLVNVLQSLSTVVIQKSLREGFGLTVTEAMWKKTPVVASNIGGIPLQITDEKDGFLVDPEDYDGFADRIVELIRNPELAADIGANAREKVRNRFLVTRLLSDYLEMLDAELRASGA
ncbi:MAG TPA: glycosyltransferase [bacterium]|nr:glycosyltransferase [bacterium]